jgi:NADH-quinone oxidoreductase subunit G
MASGAFERIADVPIYFADPLVRRSPALQKTRDAATPYARLNGRALAAAGLVDGDRVRVSAGGAGNALYCRRDDTVADGCIRLATAHAVSAGLPSLFGALTIEKIEDVIPATPTVTA